MNLTCYYIKNVIYADVLQLKCRHLSDLCSSALEAVRLDNFLSRGELGMPNCDGDKTATLSSTDYGRLIENYSVSYGTCGCLIG